VQNNWWFIGLIILLLLAAGSYHALCQQQPEKPKLVMVTVDPETGNDVIYWQKSTSPQVDYYVIAIAVKPNPLEPYALLQVGTAPASDTFFINTNSDSDKKSIGYTVWAVDQISPDTLYISLYDEPDSTIFTHATFDSCQGSITLSWNDYNTWRGNIREYNIYQRLGSGIYLSLATLSEGTNTFTLNNINENQTYSLFIEAVNKDNIRRSRSNMVNIFTRMSVNPDFVNADYATLGENDRILLSYTIDPNSQLRLYKILRSESPDGPYDTIATIQTADKHFIYVDDIAFTSGIYYYKLTAFNNCGKLVATSNLACNILMNGTSDDQTVTLNWNDYINWPSGVDHYTVYRQIGVNNVLLDSIEAGTNVSFTDNFTGRINYQAPMSNYVCYHVIAYQAPDTLGNQFTSLSNTVCFDLNTDMRIANAFVPNSNDGINNTFRPFFAFEPKRYDLIIYNRAGIKIWEGSEPWDGKVNGRMVAEGIYLYFLKVYYHSGNTKEYNGQVVVVYQ
jgi:hypothetical protein